MPPTKPTAPLFLTSDDNASALERIPLMSPAFNENRLQELIRIHPEALPIAELDPSFSPAVCIGREVGSGSGPIDNLYIGPSGGLTIVETKLWKNPEARRTVVAQLLDYTKGVARWSYSDLDDAACEYFREYGIDHKSLYGYLEETFDDLPDEQQFIDRATESLRNGRFLLLIVGDGIRRGVEEMVEYIQETPQLQFRLALVELACYRRPDQEWPLMMVPRVVVRTAEVERAVVRLDIPPDIAAKLGITVTTPPKPIDRKAGEEGFFAELESNVGRDQAVLLRGFIDAAKGLAQNLRVRATKRNIYLEVLADLDDDSSWGRVLVSRRDGNLRPLPASELKTYGGVSECVLETYWREMSAISSEFVPTIAADGNDLGQLINIDQLTKHRNAMFVVFKRFADVVAAGRVE